MKRIFFLMTAVICSGTANAFRDVVNWKKVDELLK
jgi:hypothetical protein